MHGFMYGKPLAACYIDDLAIYCSYPPHNHSLWNPPNNISSSHSRVGIISGIQHAASSPHFHAGKSNTTTI